MNDFSGEIIDLGVGQPDFPTPDHIKAAGKQAIDENFTRYTPQPGFQDLREAIARKFLTENALDVTPDQIVVSCGGKHSLYNIIQCVVRPGDEVLVLSPHWSSYAAQVKYARGTPVLVPTREEDGFQPDMAAVRAAVTTRTRALVVNSPCNPTGAVYGRPRLRALADLAVKRDLFVISDEVYEKIIYHGAEHVSIASLGPEIAARTATVGSVSKTHAMTGWRIGYAAMPPELAQSVTVLQSHSTSGPNAMGQRAALAAFAQDAEHVAAMLAEYTRRRDFLLDRLGRIEGWTCVPPQGTFYLFVNVSSWIGRKIAGRPVAGSTEFADALLAEAGVRVMAGAAFGSDRHVRISFAASLEALEEGLYRIEKLLTH
jgi:aspartate aminotransferase